MDIRTKVKEIFWPNVDDERAVNEILPNLMDLVTQYLIDREIPAKPMLVGSMAKETYLTNPDADIFILFDKNFPREQMGNIALLVE